VQPKLDSQLMKEEIFGPILPIITYQDFNEVIEFVNDTQTIGFILFRRKQAK